MVSEKNIQYSQSKTISLILAMLVILSSLIYIPDWQMVGITSGSDASLLQRFTYPLFHTSFLHAVLNAWCFLSVMFLFNLPLWRFGIAYLVAMAIPSFCLSEIPTVGLSVACYTLIGQVALWVSGKSRFILTVAIYISVGLFFPSVNVASHLYGFLSGLVIGVLTTPISIICRR